MNIKKERRSQQTSSTPQWVLRKGLGFWELTYAGQTAVFKHEQGAFYVAYLLLHPPLEPIHGLALALQIRSVFARQTAAVEVFDPSTGTQVTVASDALLEQRGLGLDEAEAMRAARRRQRELEALLEDDNEIEPVKAEAQRELEALYRYQGSQDWQTRDTAQKAADAVGKAVKRFQQHLARSLDAAGEPHAVLRAFAEHLKQHLLIPSGRCCGHGGFRDRRAFGGCFTYCPPAGVVWRG